MNARIKKLIEQFTEERREWSGVFNPGSQEQYKNICYFIANRHAAQVRDVYDISVIYDNLVVNNEILDADNISEYEPETLARMLRDRGSSRTVESIKKDIKNGFIYLMNYYPPKGDLVECFIKLKADYKAI